MKIDSLIEIACGLLGCSIDDFRNSSKKKDAAMARRFVSYYLYENGYRNENIAKAIGYSKDFVSFNNQRFKTMKNKPDVQYTYAIFLDEVEKIKGTDKWKS